MDSLDFQKRCLSANILIIDDEKISNNMLVALLKKEGYSRITTTLDSRKASQFYADLNPDLVILDLHMPHLDGFAVMAQLKVFEEKSYLPIIVISADEDQATRLKALESGAKDFLNKPYNPVEVAVRIKNLIQVRMLHNEIKDHNKGLEKKVKQRTEDLYKTQIDVIQRLARAIEIRDSETGLHIVRMSNYSACLGSECGFTDKECELILTASPLHDIGKIGIPDRILSKKNQLDKEEWEIMKTHTTIGAKMLSDGGSVFLEFAKKIALTHHEKWDGSGYPKGLKGEDIPLVGRVCGLCDVFDALTSKRPYKSAWSVEAAVDEIIKNSGLHFDPRVVESFLKILPKIKEIHDQYTDPDVLVN